MVFCANTGINKNFVMKQGGPVSDLFYHVENTIAYKEFLQLQCPNLLLIQIRIQDFLWKCLIQKRKKIINIDSQSWVSRAENAVWQAEKATRSEKRL